MPSQDKKLTYVLKVTLDDITPPIWRRLLVSGDTDLLHLHMFIQVAMPWENYHLFSFTAGGIEYSVPNPAVGPNPLRVRDLRAVTLKDVVKSTGQRLDYLYDFGDTWKHTIKVEEIRTTFSSDVLPSCTKGKRNGPPEDCGGVWGYQMLLDALRNPDRGESREQLEWLGRHFDPEKFDIDAVNTRLAEVMNMTETEIVGEDVKTDSLFSSGLEGFPSFGDFLSSFEENFSDWMSPRRSQIVVEILRHIANHVAERDLGYVLSAGASFVVDDAEVSPAVAFIKKTRLTNLPDVGIIEMSPDLAVEVTFPDEPDIVGETADNLKAFKKAGIVCWNVLPHKQQIEVHIPGQRRKVLGMNDVLEGGDILPGFSVPVAQILRT
ncbi:MAG: Uma2 family endonuclease [Chloroflexi bacterium]|nr:Uma2 family endonuclease [Chloroflexota bacterium]